MKINKTKIALVSAAMLCCASMAGCENKVGREAEKFFGKSEVTYQAETKFMYSLDQGNSWSETIQEVPIQILPKTLLLSIKIEIALFIVKEPEIIINAFKMASIGYDFIS